MDGIFHSIPLHYKLILLVESAVIKKPVVKEKMTEWNEKIWKLCFIYILNLYWRPPSCDEN